MTDYRPASNLAERTMLVIPALNEELCIGQTIAAWRELGFARFRVVDNGSTDRTVAEARRAGADVLHEPARGYGAAVWRGLQGWPSDIEWVLISSADGSDQLSRNELERWQAAVDAGADLVIGDRVSLPESRTTLSFTQQAGNWFTCQAIHWGWGKRFCDMGSLRLVRHSGLMRLYLRDRRFGWNVEMQVRAIEDGWNIVELPVRYYSRRAGESKISKTPAGTWRAGRDILRMLFFLLALRRTAARTRELKPAVVPAR